MERIGQARNLERLIQSVERDRERLKGVSEKKPTVLGLDFLRDNENILRDAMQDALGKKQQEFFKKMEEALKIASRIETEAEYGLLH